jgi:hypothetical protein
MAHQFEIGVIQQMCNILLTACVEIVYTQNRIATRDDSIAQMRTKKPRATRH